MYCKRCTYLYTLDVKQNKTVFFNCNNCGNEEEIPNYIYVSFETILYINNTILYINNKIYNFICK